MSPPAGSSHEGDPAMLEGLMDGKHDVGDDWRHVDTVSFKEPLTLNALRTCVYIYICQVSSFKADLRGTILSHATSL